MLREAFLCTFAPCPALPHAHADKPGVSGLFPAPPPAAQPPGWAPWAGLHGLLLPQGPGGPLPPCPGARLADARPLSWQEALSFLVGTSVVLW